MAFLLIVNCGLLIRTGSTLMASNVLDKFITHFYLSEIKAQERQKGLKITKIAFTSTNQFEMYDDLPRAYYDGSVYRRMKLLAGPAKAVPIIYIFAGRIYQQVEMPPDIYNQYFEGREWTTVSSDQVICIEDTAYIAIY